MMLEELVDLDEERMITLNMLIRQKERLAKAYNKTVKLTTFLVGNLVWKVILAMDKNDRVLGKWSHNWEGLFRITQVFSNNSDEIEDTNPKLRTLRINGRYLKGYKPMLQKIRII